MTCDAVQAELLSASSAAWGPLRPHLDACPRCAALAASIHDAEEGVEDALAAFATAGDIDAALARRRGAAPPSPTRSHWRLALMTSLALSTAAAAWFVVSSAVHTPQPVVVDGADGSVMAPDGAIDPSESARELPSSEVEPEPEPDADIEPFEEAGVAAVPPLADASAGIRDCGEEEALELAAVRGDLSAAALACLEGLLAPGKTGDAEAPLRLLAVDAFAREDMAAWEGHALRLATVTTDPDLHYKLALHYATDDQFEAAMHHAQVVLDMAEQWPASVRDERVSNIRGVRVRARLALLEEGAADAREEAGKEALEWLRHVRATGGKDKKALKACEALLDRDACAAPAE